MTFFLKDVQGDIPANSTRQVTSTSGFGGLVAASTASAIENDANFKAGRTRALVRKDLVQRGVEAAGGQEVWEALQEAGKAPDVPWDRLSEDRRQRLQYPPETMQILADMQSADPERFADFDFSDEGIEAATNERLQKEYEAAKAAVEMMPSGRGAAEFLGGMVGPTLDVKNVPFMLFGGGGGGFMRIMGRNAAINMAAEGAFLPSQFAMADRLEIPDPSIPGQLAAAAAAGAVFGAGEEAIRRGLGYMRTRNAVREGLSGFEAAQWDARIAMAEEALEEGGADAVQQAARAGFPNQPSTMPPLITRVETTAGTQGAQAANAPEPAITFGKREEAPAPATAPPSEAAPAQTAQDARSEAVDGLRSAAEEQRAEAGRAKKPLINFLSTGHKASKAALARGEGDGPSLQIHPDGPLGQELRARDIKGNNTVGLFSRKHGRENLDNLVASEMEDMYPGIIEATGTERGADYLDEQGLIDLIAREASGDDTWLYSRKYAADLEAEAFRIEALEDGTPQQDFIDGKRDPDGFIVDLDAYEFSHGYSADIEIEKDFDRYVHEQGVVLTPSQRAEILQELVKYGGDGKLLVRAAAWRDIEIAETPDADELYEAIPGFDDFEAGGSENVPSWPSDFGEPPVDTRPEGIGRARDAQPDGGITEATPEGDEGLEATLASRPWTRFSAPDQSRVKYEEVSEISENFAQMSDSAKQAAIQREREKLKALRSQTGQTRNSEEGILRRILAMEAFSEVDGAVEVVTRARTGAARFDADVPNWQRDLVTGLLKEFGFDRAIRVRMMGGRRKKQVESSFGGAAKAAITLPHWNFRQSGYELEVLLPTGRKNADNLASVVHELSHLLHYRVEPSRAEKVRLVAEFANSFDFQKSPSQQGVSDSVWQTASERSVAGRRNRLASSTSISAANYVEWLDNFQALPSSDLKSTISDAPSSYHRSYTEWVARQTARVLEGERVTDTVLQRYFGRLGEIWKRVQKALSGLGYRNNAVVEALNSARVRSEATPEGEQALIPGVEPVTQRDRLEAAQDAPMRGGNAPADDGLFDTGARVQRDMFSDPGQDAQKQIMDNATADLREAIASGDARVVDDFKIDLEMPDGSTRAMSASQTLDLMDDVEEFSALLDLCGSVPQK